jgi:hypothetical protein
MVRVKDWPVLPEARLELKVGEKERGWRGLEMGTRSWDMYRLVRSAEGPTYMSMPFGEASMLCALGMSAARVREVPDGQMLTQERVMAARNASAVVLAEMVMVVPARRMAVGAVLNSVLEKAIVITEESAMGWEVVRAMVSTWLPPSRVEDLVAVMLVKAAAVSTTLKLPVYTALSLPLRTLTRKLAGAEVAGRVTVPKVKDRELTGLLGVTLRMRVAGVYS